MSQGKNNVIVNIADNGTNNNGVDTNSGTNESTDGTNINGVGINSGTNNDAQRKAAIIEMMRHNKSVSVTQISKTLNIPRRTLFRIIYILKSENRIKRVGDLKSGSWEVIE